MSEERRNITARWTRNMSYIILGIVVGTTWIKADLGTTAAELLSQDSQHVQGTITYTQELKDEASLFIKTNAIVDANGCPTAEWLQFKSDQRAIAKRRGSQTSLEPAITWLQSLRFW